MTMMNRRRRIKGILSHAACAELPPELLKQLRAEGWMPAIAGGAPDDDDDDAGKSGKGDKDKSGANADDDDDSDDDDDDDDADDDDDDDKGKKGKGKKGKGKSDDDDDDDDGYVRMPKSEVQRLRREKREAVNAKKKADREARERREQELADKEQWKDLAEERQERIAELEGEVEELKGAETKRAKQGLIAKVAKRLRFEYPDDAHRFLDQDDLDDEQSIEAALRTVLQDRPKLKAKRKGSGAPIPGDNGDDDGKGGALTIEEVRKMSPEEINKRWDEVQAVLRQQEVAST